MPKTYLKDYTPPAFFIENTDLDFTLNPCRTRVKLLATMVRNSGHSVPDLVLDGENLDLISVKIDGVTLAPESYRLDEDTSQAARRIQQLHLFDVPDRFTLEIENTIVPSENKSMSGLYMSGDNFSTQCESQGFRAMTFYLDRPDVMSTFTVQLTGDKQAYPYLLSNGDLVSSHDNADGTHTAVWHDPHKKPCYLFALVAGDMVKVTDSFTTMNGDHVDIHFYADKGTNPAELSYGVACLKNAMKWDEDVFGRAYDLGLYQVVASKDFNSGAMENKGLNIFNTSYVLGSEKTATDTDLNNIDAVIAHEYFHNWSGNRVTCRDWFQLSLKEGFTVLRDALYTADQTSELTKRIEDARTIKEHQFREDAGPNAHPIRPHFFTSIRNFYTATVYEKGAEVIRMLYNLFGKEGFRAGTDLYFERHDGEAVTTEDFVQAMADANDTDLTQFKRWYDQGGTPQVAVSENYDAAAQEYRLTLSQTVRQLDGYPEPQPFHIPVAIGLMDARGNAFLDGNSSAFASGTQVLDFKKQEQTFTFKNIPEKPVLSLLRNFSAPVQIIRDVSKQELMFLMRHDSDPFNRWEAGQQLMRDTVAAMVSAPDQAAEIATPIVGILLETAADTSIDPMVRAEMLTVPSEKGLHLLFKPCDPHAVHQARETLLNLIAEIGQSTLASIFAVHQKNTAGDRALKNLAMTLLARNGDTSRPQGQFTHPTNMTDEKSAFAALTRFGSDAERSQAATTFYDRWQDNVDVVDGWITLQCVAATGLAQINALRDHPDLDLQNPNKIRAFIGGVVNNPTVYHTAEGYRWLADEILRVDSFNAELAARLTGPLTSHALYNDTYAELMQTELRRIMATGGLSADTKEMVSNALKEEPAAA